MFFKKGLNTKKNTIAVLDGVRAIACLSVIAFHINLISIDLHIWQPYPATNFLISAIAFQGGSGVTLFFVLSGFLLFLPYARALLFEKDWPSARRFYLRRVLRIWPGYYVSLILLVCLMFPWYLQPQRWPELGLFLTFFMDSTAATFQKMNGPFWTLAVEWQYYMLLPLLALLMLRIAGRGSLQQRWWKLVACLVGLMAWGVFSRYWGFHFSTNPNETLLVPRPALNVALFFLYGAGGKFLEDFAVGMLISSCYVLVLEKAEGHALSWIGEKARKYSYWLLGAGMLILLIMTAWNGYQRFQPHTAAIFDALIPAYNQWSEFGLSWGYGLCMAALLFGPAILRKPLEWQPMRGIGLISYGMYMWHLPLLIQFTFKVQHRFMAGWNQYLTYGIYWLFVLLFIIPFCYLFYRFIERPGIRLGDRLLAKKATKGAPADSHAPAQERSQQLSRPLETAEAGARTNH